MIRGFRKILNFLISLYLLLSAGCADNNGRCNNDLDCPRNLICRNNRCVGLYEIYDTAGNIDIQDYDYVANDAHLSDIVELVEEGDAIEPSDDLQNDIKDIGEDFGDVSEDYWDLGDVIQIECKYDGDCKSEFQCISGKCVNYMCKYELISGFCFINQYCYKDGDTSPFNECLICNSRVNDRDWSSRDGEGCKDDGYECTDDICKDGVCVHPNKWRDKCSNGICDGKGNCVQCLINEDCDSSTIDKRCESVDCINNQCVYQKRADGSGCGPENEIYCYICNNGKCGCNSPNYECDSCLPSCGVLGGICCNEGTSCSIGEKGKSYDCYLCCEGECIPY
jgi:hypothetical protein